MSGYMGYIVLIIVVACAAAWGLVELVGKRIEKEKAAAGTAAPARAASSRRSTGKTAGKPARKSASKSRAKSRRR